MLANHIAHMWWLGNKHPFSPLELLLACASAIAYPWSSASTYHAESNGYPHISHRPNLSAAHGASV